MGLNMWKCWNNIDEMFYNVLKLIFFLGGGHTYEIQSENKKKDFEK